MNICGSLETETRHLWWLTTELTKALTAGNPVRIDEVEEGLDIMAKTAENLTIRDSAQRTLTASLVPGPCAVVAFRVAEAAIAGLADTKPAVSAAVAI